MRLLPHAILLLVFPGSTAMAQPVLINEVQPACQRTITAPDGGHPDWIELYAPGRRPVDLVGYSLSTGIHSHRIDGTLAIAGGGYLVLWFDGRPDQGADHVGLKLSREGGTLMLIAPDGSTVVDLFTWPSLPTDASMGRCPDGARTWSLFPHPTPGMANGSTPVARRWLAPPTLRQQGDTVIAEPSPGVEVRYTLDGSPVTAESPLMDGDRAMTTGVIRARAYAPDALPSQETLLTMPAGEPARPRLSLAIDPFDLHDPQRGLFSTGPNANYSRTGRDWQVNALLDVEDRTGHATERVGLAIAGSGSRGLPKRSYKLFTRDRFGSEGPLLVPGLAAWDELLLRADASPNAFLRNVFMECVAERMGGRVDVPHGVPVDLSINGVPQGLYRALPPKNGDWIMATHGEEAIDLADGPGANMLRGDRDHLDRSLEALFRASAMDSVDALIDLNSLIDLACLDLYTGRADHDLNVRCWRPRRAGGRWRWILFDMDLWSPAAENSLERMCSATAPETPYLPQLLAHPELRLRMLARSEAMLLTVLEPHTAMALADSIHRANEEAMVMDQARWDAELHGAGPEACLAELHAHIAERPARLLSHIAAREHLRTRAVTLEGPPREQGVVFVADLPLAEGSVRMELLCGIPLRIRAEAAEGWVFDRWVGEDGAWPELELDPARTARLRAVFRKGSPLGDDRLEQ